MVKFVSHLLNKIEQLNNEQEDLKMLTDTQEGILDELTTRLEVLQNPQASSTIVSDQFLIRISEPNSLNNIVWKSIKVNGVERLKKVTTDILLRLTTNIVDIVLTSTYDKIATAKSITSFGQDINFTYNNAYYGSVNVKQPNSNLNPYNIILDLTLILKNEETGTTLTKTISYNNETSFMIDDISITTKPINWPFFIIEYTKDSLMIPRTIDIIKDNTFTIGRYYKFKIKDGGEFIRFDKHKINDKIVGTDVVEIVGNNREETTLEWNVDYYINIYPWTDISSIYISTRFSFGLVDASDNVIDLASI